MSSSVSVKIEVGKFFVMFKEAKNTKPMEVNGQSDPYCIFSLGKESDKFQTKVVKKTSNPVWNEEFVLDVLDPNVPLEIEVLDKGKKDEFLGYVELELKPFNDQQTKDVWVKIRGPRGKKEKKVKKRGELHLKVQYVKYSNLVSTLIHPQSTLVRALSKVFVKDDLAAALITIFKENDQLLPLIKKIITDEVNTTARSETLFRTDSMATKLMKEFSRIIGLYWVELVLGPLVVNICENATKLAVEIDPSKLRPGENRETNVKNLIDSVNAFLSSILNSVSTCPQELREICRHLAENVEKKFPDAKEKAVGAIIFLRLLCPAILSPENFGLVDEPPSIEARRHLILVAKVIQNLANGIEFGNKEQFMVDLNPLILAYIFKIQNFLNELGFGPASSTAGAPPSLPRDVIVHQLDYVVQLISGHMDKLRGPLSGHEQLFSLLSAEVEMKFMPLLELQKEQEKRMPRKRTHKLHKLFHLKL